LRPIRLAPSRNDFSGSGANCVAAKKSQARSGLGGVRHLGVGGLLELKRGFEEPLPSRVMARARRPLLERPPETYSAVHRDLNPASHTNRVTFPERYAQLLTSLEQFTDGELLIMASATVEHDANTRAHRDLVLALGVVLTVRRVELPSTFLEVLTRALRSLKSEIEQEEGAER
jgi:hypothetical protein